MLAPVDEFLSSYLSFSCASAKSAVHIRCFSTVQIVFIIIVIIIIIIIIIMTGVVSAEPPRDDGPRRGL